MIVKIVCLILLTGVAVAELRPRPKSIGHVRVKRWRDSYKVTIYNDNRVTDFHGFVHTWLVIKNGNRETTFSFSAGGQCGTSTASAMRNRTYSDKLEYNLSKSQYDNMIAEIGRFYDSCPGYSFLANPGTYNCVTSANRILSAGGIWDFSSCGTPQDVQNTIRRDFNYQFANSDHYITE